MVSASTILPVKIKHRSQTLNQLGLFAKFWQPGSVKTRLAATIGEIAACEVFQSFLFHLLVRHRDSADRRSVVFSPPERETEFRESISSDWNLEPQSSGDLGRRMQTFFEQQCARFDAVEQLSGDRRLKIVVIGADCPKLSQAIVQSAFDALDDNEVVIGPSTDGGYYLIGMRDRCFDIFSNIQWSTSKVLEQTVRQLNDQQIKYFQLSPLTDVDNFEDLLELVADFECRKKLGELDSLDLDLYRRILSAIDRGSSVEPE